MSPIIFWIRRGLRLREALDMRPPDVEIGPAAKALLDFRNMTGGGPVDAPTGMWTVNETLTIGSNIHLSGLRMTGSADPAILGVGDHITLTNLHFHGFPTAVKVPMT